MLQELGGLGGTPDVGTWDTDNSGNSVLSALENIGVNFAAGAATVGLSAIGKAAGVSPVYSNPAALAYNSSLLTRPPGSVSPVGAALGVSGNALLIAGVLLVGGLMFAVAFRRKG